MAEIIPELWQLSRDGAALHGRVSKDERHHIAIKRARTGQAGKTPVERESFRGKNVSGSRGTSWVSVPETDRRLNCRHGLTVKSAPQ